MPFGIALAGGGARGAAHVGVLLALEEAGLRPSAIAGASAGGIVAGLYASGLSAEKIRDVVLDMSKNGVKLMDPDYKGMAAAIPQLFTRRDVTLSGLIKGERFERYLCSLTKDKHMRDCRIKTVIPAVDLVSGNTIAFVNSVSGVRPQPRVRFRTGAQLCQAMHASAAFPAVFRPVKLGDMVLVDGGVTDVLPVNLLRATGERNIFAVDVAEAYEMPENYSLFEVASHSLSIMRLRLYDCVSRGESLLLHPELPEEAGLLSFECMPACMEAGYEAARAMMPVIREKLRV